MSDQYAHLRNGSGPVRDLTATWERLRPIGDADDEARTAIERFCESKRIAFADLAALGTRWRRDHDTGYWLAWGGSNGNGQVVAVKYRPLEVQRGGVVLLSTSKDCTAEPGSKWVLPIIIGKTHSTRWMVVEGETDAARLHGLVGDTRSIMVLPTGAHRFEPEWADLIPRGATVALCHDADEAGDAGAAKAVGSLGGRIVRVRPPIEGTDWCDWEGDREAFLTLAKPVPRYSFVSFVDFASREFPEAEPLLGDPERIFLAIGSLLMAYGADGSGKSTLAIDAAVHLAAGEDWLGIPVPRPVRIAIIENEGPPSLFRQKLVARVECWEGDDPRPNLFMHVAPWGEFSFADPDARTALREFCTEHQIDLVMANPTLGLGVGASGKPDETQEFVDWLVECGLKTTLAFWLLHHENKAGQISGDWGRHPDTKMLVQRDGDAQRTKLDWAKTRWATLDQEAKLVLLDWVTETQGYRVITKAAASASDAELVREIQAFLIKKPGASTRAVRDVVEGTNTRISAVLKANFHDASPRTDRSSWMPRSDALWNHTEPPNHLDGNPRE